MSNATEQIIKDAIKRGEFDNLQGKGKPLTHLDENLNTPEPLRMAYTVLKNSGYVPPEAMLMQDIAKLKERIGACNNESERKALVKEMSDMQLKLRLMIEAMKRDIG